MKTIDVTYTLPIWLAEVVKDVANAMQVESSTLVTTALLTYFHTERIGMFEAIVIEAEEALCQTKEFTPLLKEEDA